MNDTDRMRRFREARFGLFLHWGLYSVLGRNEWSMYLDRMPLSEYEKLVDRFNPERYDPDAWAGLAGTGGAIAWGKALDSSQRRMQFDGPSLGVYVA